MVIEKAPQVEKHRFHINLPFFFIQERNQPQYFLSSLPKRVTLSFSRASLRVLFTALVKGNDLFDCVENNLTFSRFYLVQ